MSSDNAPTKLRSWPARQADTYRHGEDRPLAGYLKLMSIYAAGTVSSYLTARRLGRTVPRLDPWDVAQLSVATHKVARLVAKDPVTSPLRAPFTSYAGVSAPGELDEEVRGHGFRHSVGELLTCPMCLAQWVATAFSLGLMVSPATTKLVMSTFTAIAGADFLQHVYVKLQETGE